MKLAYYLYSEYSSLEKLGSPRRLMTGMTETGLETTFIDLLRFTGRAGFSGLWAYSDAM